MQLIITNTFILVKVTEAKHTKHYIPDIPMRTRKSTQTTRSSKKLLNRKSTRKVALSRVKFFLIKPSDPLTKK